MTLLNTANKLYVGATAIDKGYAGTNLVWQPPATGSWGSDEYLYGPGTNNPGAPSDPNTFMVGARMTILADGRITHFRYWHHGGSTPLSRYVTVWSDTGTLLASATSPTSVPGWNTYPLATPLNVTANQVIRAATGYPGSGVGASFAFDLAAPPIPSGPDLRFEAGVYTTPQASGGDTMFPDNTITPNHYYGDVVYQKKLAAYPAVLNSAAAWIDATQDSFADGAVITSYTSHSTSGRVFTGSGALNYRAAIDGKPRLDFNTGWLKSAGYTPPSSGFTFVIVKRITGVSPSSGIGMPMVYNEDAYNNYEMRLSSFLQIQMVYEYNNGAPAVTSDVVVTTARDYLIWCEWNTITNAPVRMFINNVLHGEGTFTPAGITAPTAALIIGTRGYAGDFPEIMQVGEAVVFNGVLSDAARTEVANYLIAKWSISLAARDAPTALPALPPFVNGAPPP